jgi:hypothetical protein
MGTSTPFTRRLLHSTRSEKGKAANSEIRSLKSKMNKANHKIITLQARLKEAKVAQKSKQPGGHSRSLEPIQLKSPNTIQREKAQICVEEFERKEAVKLANRRRRGKEAYCREE